MQVLIREDFKKVFDVVREQVEKALQGKTNSGPKTFDEFRNKVKNINDFIFINVDISFVCFMPTLTHHPSSRFLSPVLSLLP